MSKDKGFEKWLVKAQDTAIEYCICSGYTCSGCEKKHKEIIRDVSNWNRDRYMPIIVELVDALEFYNDKDMFEQGHGLDFHETARDALNSVKEKLGDAK